jgi:hypothetical protein
LVPEGFGFQTGHRCSDCWVGHSPLLALEVMNRGARGTLRTDPRKERQRKAKKGTVTTKDRRARDNARFAALNRIGQLFPDVYAVILDEERVKRGLHPIARYNPIEFEHVVSETLDFNDVYDALRSSGVTDGP